MPFPNEHACRVKDPAGFQKGSFRRMKRGKLSIIIGRLKGKTTTTTQAFRYPIGTWTAAQARAHCQEQKGNFEAAQPKKETDVDEQVDHVQSEDSDSQLEDKAIVEEMASYGPRYGAGACATVGNATSFAELDSEQQAQQVADSVHYTAGQFQGLVANIMASPDVDDKAGAIGKLAVEFGSKVGEAMSETKEIGENEQVPLAEVETAKGISLKDKLINAIKSVFETDEPERKPGFTVWKEADGTYRWFAVFSNKYRDRDNPPEILSDAAHKEFVAAVDAGDWPMPKLWLWHVKGSESGYADWLAYDDNGFNCASGVVADRQVAEKLAGMGDLLVSHGMPVEHIQRDKNDSTIITGYRSIEISPLPAWAAANELTDFALLKEANDMAIPEEKKDFLRQAGLSDEQIATIEDGLKEKAEEAKGQGLEFKDTESEPVEEQATETETETEPAGSGEVEDNSLTRDEVVDAIAAAFQPLQQQLEALVLVQAEQAKTLKQLTETDETKVAKKASLTPAASLAELVAQRVIGSPEAKVDGRKKLSKSGPKETEPIEVGLNPTPVPFINNLLTQGQTVN